MADLEWFAAERRFRYLSSEDSKLYAAVQNSADEKDQVIKQLLERLAASSRSAHVASRY
jgi:hypothetical protein